MAKLRKLVENRKTRTGCTGTSLTCTGTSWPKMTRTEVVPVQAQIVPVQVTRECQNVCFLTFFPLLLFPNHFYTSNTHQNNSKFTLESLFYSILFQWIIFLPNSFINHFQGSFQHGSQPIPQIKHDDYLGFNLNPSSITCN